MYKHVHEHTCISAQSNAVLILYNLCKWQRMELECQHFDITLMTLLQSLWMLILLHHGSKVAVLFADGLSLVTSKLI